MSTTQVMSLINEHDEEHINIERDEIIAWLIYGS
jgi:hypothetical protein